MKSVGKLTLAAGAVALLLPFAAAAETAPGDVKIVDMMVSDSLTGQPGDALNGRKVVADRRLGNCLACHAVTELKDQAFHGNVGPALDGAGSRWEEAQLRAILVNSKSVFDGTVMPAFYRTDGFNRLPEDRVGKTILSAQDVEDVIAYLKTLKE